MTESPINICALSSAFFKSYFVAFIITSSLKFIKHCKNLINPHGSGFLSTIAKELKPKEL